jgi:hypothetical protein
MLGCTLFDLRRTLLSTELLFNTSELRRIRKKIALGCSQWWANLDQASKDLDKTIFRDLSPTPIP